MSKQRHVLDDKFDECYTIMINQIFWKNYTRIYWDNYYVQIQNVTDWPNIDIYMTISDFPQVQNIIVQV